MRVVRTIGVDAPYALVEACGLMPAILSAGTRPTPRADALMGTKGLGPRGRSLLEQMLDSTDPVLITRADAEQMQVFAIVRELARLGEASPAPTHLYDLRHFDRPASRAYNAVRTEQLIAWLVSLGGVRPDGAAIAAAETARAEIAALFATARPRLTGVAAFELMRQSPAEIGTALAALPATPSTSAIRLYLAGTAPEHAGPLAVIEAAGATIVGEAWPHPFSPLADRTPSTDMMPAAVAARVAAGVAASNATHVLHLTQFGDEAAPWDVAAMRRALPTNVAFAALDTRRDFAVRVTRFLRDEPEPAPPPRVAPSTAPAKRGDSTRSRKSLQSIADFSAYQRGWFAQVRARVTAGERFAVVNANAPQEILRALDVPFVVNQWWASIVAAKQQSRRYVGLLKAHDFPTHVEPYSAQALAAAFDDDADNAPWGGLPRPDFVHAITSSDATAKIFAELAGATGANPFLYERTVDPRWQVSTNWWAELPDRWDDALEPARLDLLVAELHEVIARVEGATGRTLDPDRLVEVMNLVNEQEQYYRETRDMIAAAPCAPIGIVDSMPATMVPQWHRGTVWARDAAKAFHDEVAQRVADGAGVCADERVRLMWVGRGMWNDMAFVQRWEDSHGAVFVWSMYLALAADGYIRHFDRGRDPLRALAARFLTMGDELRMPSWGAPWHVHEARTHRVDGAVALNDADPFVIRALEQAGVPVLALDMDNFSGGDGDEAARRITAFIEGPATDKARTRRGA